MVATVFAEVPLRRERAALQATMHKRRGLSAWIQAVDQMCLLKTRGAETVLKKAKIAKKPKLKATVNALKSQYPDRKLVACMELHTYSSLNATFITSYRGTLNPADEALVFYSPKALAMKRLPPLAPSDIASAFAKQNLVVTTDAAQVLEFLDKQEIENTNFLFMSSGNYGGADLQEWAKAALAN